MYRSPRGLRLDLTFQRLLIALDRQEGIRSACSVSCQKTDARYGMHLPVRVRPPDPAHRADTAAINVILIATLTCESQHKLSAVGGDINCRS